MKKKKHMGIWILSGVLAALVIGVFAFIGQPSFGRLPQGARLERVRRSPNYRDGEFRNEQKTPMLTSGKSRFATMAAFLFGRKEPNLRPGMAIPAVKTDLRALPADRDLLVWFGHSSYLLQVGQKRYLIDPVFCDASPVGFFNKPFEGTDIHHPEDMPDIDYLVITHDHWDHLDYKTVKRLNERIGRVICPLGVGAHFERWGFAPERLVEMDWNEEAALGDSAVVYCLPSRHFSGRGPQPNQTLWASYLLETPGRKVYMAGDGGYDDRFVRIGERFPGIDLAILENGQYNDDWRYIHMMPDQMPRAAHELGAAQILTVHHSKYALARHPWDEPLENERRMRGDSLNVLSPQIGEVVEIGVQEGR